ncbi:MAG: hypothetical protein M1831_005411 [Alyxoria varia]|nr:MAG: hypothetical protein M1831_005411 [Alyxoria varia]
MASAAPESRNLGQSIPVLKDVQGSRTGNFIYRLEKGVFPAFKHGLLYDLQLQILQVSDTPAHAYETYTFNLCRERKAHPSIGADASQLQVNQNAGTRGCGWLGKYFEDVVSHCQKLSSLPGAVDVELVLYCRPNLPEHDHPLGFISSDLTHSRADNGVEFATDLNFTKDLVLENDIESDPTIQYGSDDATTERQATQQNGSGPSRMPSVHHGPHEDPPFTRTRLLAQLEYPTDKTPGLKFVPIDLVVVHPLQSSTQSWPLKKLWVLASPYWIIHDLLRICTLKVQDPFIARRDIKMNRDSKGNPIPPSPSSTNPSPQPYKSLEDSAKNNASQLGDPVSLKAETSNTKPTEKDLGAQGEKRQDDSGGASRTETGTEGGNSNDNETLKEKVQRKIKENPTALGDPVSLKAETKDDTGKDGEVQRDERSKL